MIIYKITNLKNNKTYVGQTTRSLEKRWKDHISYFKKSVDYILYRAMKKHGIENFKIEQIDTAICKKELNKKEAHWIEKLQAMSYQNGYNCLAVDNRLETSEFTKNKHRKNSIKKWNKKEYREKISNSLRNFKLEQYKEKFNVYKALKKGSKEKGFFVGSWYNQKTCEKDLKISNIGPALNGLVAQCKGYIFEYEDKYKKVLCEKKWLKNKEKRNSHKKFKVYKSLGKGKGKGDILVGTWFNQKECAKFLNIDASTIPYCLSGKLKQSQGYVFELIK